MQAHWQQFTQGTVTYWRLITDCGPSVALIRDAANGELSPWQLMSAAEFIRPQPVGHKLWDAKRTAERHVAAALAAQLSAVLNDIAHSV